MAATDLQMSYAAFHKWLMSNSEENQDERNRVKKMIPLALDVYITGIQKQYIVHYILEGMNIYQIAEMYGVCASTVSRGIHRGLNNMFRYLRFASPAFCECVEAKTDLRKRRMKNVSVFMAFDRGSLDSDEFVDPGN